MFSHFIVRNTFRTATSHVNRVTTLSHQYPHVSQVITATNNHITYTHYRTISTRTPSFPGSILRHGSYIPTRRQFPSRSEPNRIPIRRTHVQPEPTHKKTRADIERELELEYLSTQKPKKKSPVMELIQSALQFRRPHPHHTPPEDPELAKAKEQFKHIRFSFFTRFMIAVSIIGAIGATANYFIRNHKHRLRRWIRKIRGREHIPRKHHKFIPLTKITDDKVYDHDQFVYRITIFQRNLVNLTQRVSKMGESCKELGAMIEKWKVDQYLPVTEFTSEEAADDKTLAKLDRDLNKVIVTLHQFMASMDSISHELEILNEINVDQYKHVPLKAPYQYENAPDNVKKAVLTLCEKVTAQNQSILNLHYKLDQIDDVAVESYHKWNRVKADIAAIEKKELEIAKTRHLGGPPEKSPTPSPFSFMRDDIADSFKQFLAPMNDFEEEESSYLMPQLFRRKDDKPLGQPSKKKKKSNRRWDD